MSVARDSIEVQTHGKGLYEITGFVAEALRRSGLSEGVATVFVQHTSASLVIMENADPDVARDLQNWLDRLVPEGDPNFRHTTEGEDDMPAHIKVALTRTSESIPFSGNRLLLGTWQGVFLWEHRRARNVRRVVVSFVGE
jgi:secondary thiamine-phosphate synthase enzyme